MYKWVDKDGVTHYTQTPPTGHNSEVMAPPDPPAESPEQARARTRSISKTVNRHLKNQQQQEKDEQKNAAVKARKQKNCQIARRNLKALTRSTNRVRKKTNGKLIGVNEAERVDLINQQQQNVNKYCGDA
jgi:hypothetical protein